MNILADQIAAQSTCTVRWCDGHLPTDDGRVVHISRERVVIPTAGGTSERKPFYISLEQVGDGMPAGRFEPSQDPLTLWEMAELVGILQATLLTAVASRSVTR
jgi:hypothetical protein